MNTQWWVENPPCFVPPSQKFSTNMPVVQTTTSTFLMTHYWVILRYDNNNIYITNNKHYLAQTVKGWCLPFSWLVWAHRRELQYKKKSTPMSFLKPWTPYSKPDILCGLTAGNPYREIWNKLLSRHDLFMSTIINTKKSVCDLHYVISIFHFNKL